MKIGDKHTVTIEKISNLGLGIARVDGIVVFVENTCPNDEVIVEITHIKKSFAKAVVTEIVKPSEYRVHPFCPMQKVCGACQLQFIDYTYQLELKREIVKDTLYSIAGIDFNVLMPIASPEKKEYRCKVQYPISQTKVSKKNFSRLL